MMKAFKRAGETIIAGAAFFGAMTTIVFADTVTLCDPLGTNCAYGNETFASVALNVTNFLFTYIAIPLATIMVLVGAFQMMTSAGDPEKFSQGRKTLIYAAIGFAVAILASGITSLITNVLTGQ
jgi:hypothetical protein